MKILSILALSVLILSACGGKETAATIEDKTVTPVTLTSPENVTINEEISLSAISAYLLKIDVKAPINGYVQSSSVKLGQTVSKGSTLFILKTKEAQSLGNTINKLDPSFNFSGLNKVKSPVNGFISQLNHQSGDYVQDGEQLAMLIDKNSFGFLMNLPYEYHQLLAKNKNVNI
ncbi:MAG TPA: HlyD family efflux transporter periplasmic adaptor subunit, partial [Pelobium sp.]